MRLTLMLLTAMFALAVSAGRFDAAGDDVFTNAQYGFRIKRPVEPWKLSEPAAPEGARYALKLGHSDGKTETSVTVYVADAGEIKTSQGARDSAEQKWKAEPRLSNITRGIENLAAGEACWLRAEYDAGAKYVLRQHFFVKNGFVYILQCAAPKEAFSAAEKDFKASLATFGFVPLDGSAVDIKALAARCGSEIKWAATWQEAAARAKKEDKLIVVCFEVYRGVVSLRIAPLRVFSDQDVIELVNERLVALNWTDATNAPFDDPAVYGLGPSTFGQGLLFVTHEGKVVGQAVAFNAFHVYSRALEVLKAHPGAPAKDPSDPAELLRRGELDAAGKLLATADAAKDWRLVAALARKRRDGPKVLACLEHAPERDSAERRVAEAIMHLRMGNYAKAENQLKGIEAPQALYWRAISRGMPKGAESIRAELRELCRKHPDSPFAWRAAALLQLFEYAPVVDDPRWPDAAHLAACDQPAWAAIPDAAKAQLGAVEFLEESQQENGAWLSPMSLSPEVHYLAITALCAEALLPHRKRAKSALAIERALKLVLDAPLIAEKKRTFDYTIWSQIFALRFLARCVRAEVGDKAALRRKMDGLIAELARTQESGGGWSYVRLEGREDNSIGFVTAAALCALHEARAAGAKAPPAAMIARAIDTLEWLCTPKGSFLYMQGAGDKEAEASLRAPLYALALKRHNRDEAPALAAALDTYLKHHTYTRKERGKALCHTGQEGFASYYLLFGYSFAAEALAELPPEASKKYRDALTEDVLDLRLEDGSFCDNAMIGRTYGAAMALQALGTLAGR